MDRISPERRSENMRAIRGRDTHPERVVRSLLHALGYRYRTHMARLPGRPDIVFTRRRKAVFVHGCFWHRHPGCSKAYTPKTRLDFWQRKFDGNVARDAAALDALKNDGWDVLVVWECEAANPDRLAHTLTSFLGPPIYSAREIND